MNLTVFTIAEAAEIARVSPGTIRNWINAEVLPAWKEGRVVRIYRPHLEQHLQRQFTDDELQCVLSTTRHRSFK